MALTGVDDAIVWSAAPRIWTALSGPITVALIATHLSVEEQGYYFTFNSIVGLQVLFELGLATAVQQFAGHEGASLDWRQDGTIGGDPVHKARLASLLRKALRWYGIAAFLLAGAFLVGGSVFFAPRAIGAAGWQGPWIAMTFVTAGSLLLSPAFAVLEGCGVVARVARVRTEQVIVGRVVTWCVLLAGGRLWAPAAAVAAALLLGVARISLRWRRFFADLARTTGGEISWRSEVWPFQWRTALSGGSTHLALQVFTPLLFAYEGAATAGRMGLTLAVVSMMLSLSMAWLSTKRPIFARRVARREFAQLDELFFPAMGRGFAVMAAGSAGFIIGVEILGAIHHPWHERLLARGPLMMLTAALLATQVLWAESTYLRAHRKEALLGVRLTSAALVVTSTALLGRRWGATGMTAGFLVVSLVALGGGTWVFLRRRSEWHV